MAATTLSTTASRRAILGGFVAAPAFMVVGINTALAATSANPAGWLRLKTNYHAAVAHQAAVTPPPTIANAGDEAENAFNEAVTKVGVALAAACKYPVTSWAALAEKCEMLSAEYPDADCLDGYDCAYIIADVRRLAAREA